jgi:hypothetical protein
MARSDASSWRVAEKYNEHLAWKTEGYTKQFESLLRENAVDSLCRLCYRLKKETAPTEIGLYTWPALQYAALFDFIGLFWSIRYIFIPAISVLSLWAIWRGVTLLARRCFCSRTAKRAILKD